MKEKKVAYKEAQLEWYYLDQEDIVTLSGSEQGPMDEDDLGNMGLG